MRLRLLAALPLLALFATSALAQPAGDGWKPTPIKITTLDKRLHFHGYFDGFEKVVGSNIATYGAYVALTHEDDSISYTIGQIGGSGTRISNFPAVLKISGGKGVQITRHGSDYRWASHYGAQLNLGGSTFYLIDANCNEDLGEKEKDAIVGPYSRTASPFDGTAWTEKGGWEIHVDGKKCWVRPVKMPRSGRTDEINAAWRTLNAWRQAAGSPSLKWDEETARHCRAHARYCERNKLMTHEQVQGKPGYTEEGAEAGRNSVLSFAYTKPRDAILEQLGTSYHLSVVITPELMSTGMAMVGKNFCCSTQDTGGSLPEYPVAFVWPPHGSSSIPRAYNFTGEHPMPIPGKEGNYRLKLGQPILAKVEEGCEPYSLVVKTSRGRLVKGTLTTPKKGVNHPAAQYNAGLVILAPDKPLPGNTSFIATLKMKREGKDVVRSWIFKTGSKAHRVTCKGFKRR